MSEVQVPIVKGKASLTINTDEIPEDVYREIVLQGLKVILNRGTSKIKKSLYPDEEELKAAAMAKAAEQLDLVKTSKIKFTGGKAKKASGAVMTEAMRVARALVRDAMKAQGLKISHYPASEITKAAKALLDSEQGPSILAQAEATIAERSKAPTLAVDIKAIIHESPELVAKAEAAKAAKKGQLSAKQAGMPVKRKKGGGAEATQH